ncbi:FAD-binding and (Fe-S)-binding domain-containing protein [Luteococcus sp. OSA5]|uniref:FAD-binding and (Fe-S)-binding domain-containing protein n=1 Tax=Luteococcus sp. OSA5 TaxID=3401630 RepID=UPI003B429D54
MASNGAADWKIPGLDEGQVSERLVDRIGMAHDASHYLVTPRVVVTAASVADVAAVMRQAAQQGRRVTFRSGGTSLSGQALSDDVLLDVRQNFRGVTVLDQGQRVRCEPGATVRSVNAHLAPFGRRLGPDPASEIACTVGGVVANNSSGMSCGTERNTYRTLDSMVLVLPSGTVVDTSQPDADERLRRDEPALWEGLASLRDRVRGNPDSLARIAQQYAMKNTMGYGVNSFVDHDQPVRILEHLVIGSEGTLGFVAEATFRTVPVHPFAATALLVVDELGVATDALGQLVQGGATALELMDAASLRVVQQYKEASPDLAELQVQRHAALLVEATSDDPDDLAARMSALNDVMAGLPIAEPPRFTDVAAERADLWYLRKGLYTSVAGARPAGTTNLLEDVAVPVDSLTATIDDLAGLFGSHGYDDAVIFGHAKDGNIHFMINPTLSDPRQLETYSEFTEQMVDAVLARQGTLKAEHGTGRIMAPYVRRQFGDELYEVMRQVKQLADPKAILNPGTLLDESPTGHLENLKTMPQVDDFVDRCVECGYCEPTCPSKDLTTTPRRRIALLREIQVRPEAEAEELRKAYDYEAVDTCAVDSLCAKACPVLIDTGVFMKTFRAQRHGALATKASVALAEHWGPVTTGLRAGMKVADVLPSAVLEGATRLGRTVISKDVLPVVGSDLPGSGAARPQPKSVPQAKGVMFASCLGEIFGPSESGCGRGVTDALGEICRAAGVGLEVPDLSGLCCGTVWVSKGFTEGAAAMAERTFDVLWAASRQGALPIVGDASSCTHGLEGLATHLPPHKAELWRTVVVEDAVSFVARECLPHLQLEAQGTMVLHPTCSMIHLGCVEDAIACARAVYQDVVVPVNAGCCGFAGDRGMLHPELTASATAAEAREVERLEQELGRRGKRIEAHASANRTCEMGMSRATGKEYRHVLELVAERLPGHERGR